VRSFIHDTRQEVRTKDEKNKIIIINQKSGKGKELLLHDGQGVKRLLLSQ
jgi:hypothetical protein